MEMKTFNNWREYLASKDSTESLGILLGNGTNSENPFVVSSSATANPFVEFEIKKPLVNKYFKQDMRSLRIDALLSAGYPLSWWAFLLASYRLMVRISLVIFNTSDSAIVFSRGNIRKFIEIGRELEKQAR